MKELLIHHPLRLLVLLPSLPHFQALKKLDLLQDNSEWLKSLNIHMEFAVDCAIEDQNALQHYFDFPITINSHPYNEIAQSYGCIQSRSSSYSNTSDQPFCSQTYFTGCTKSTTSTFAKKT